MATYYWVGGAGTWNASSTTNWAASSGGAGGAGFPTSSDDVIFDASSGTGTVTLSSAVCKNMTASSTSALTFSGGVNLYGDVVLGGSGTFTNFSLYLSATTNSSINTGGKTINSFSGGVSGVTWTLQSNVTPSNWFTFSLGTLNLNGFTISSTYCAFGVSGGTSNLTFNGGTISLNYTSASLYAFEVKTGSTFTTTAGTGTGKISFTGSAGVKRFRTNNCTFNCTIENAASTALVLTDGFTATTLSNSVAPSEFQISGTSTVSTLNITSTSANRCLINSYLDGTRITLSVGAFSGTTTNTSWQDIGLTGAVATWTAPFGVWDLGNNTGITFNTSTAYWIAGSGNWNDGTHWSLSSGGSAANAIPGPSNSVVFDVNSNVTTNNWNVAGIGYCKNFTATNTVDGQMTVQNVNVYGNIDLSLTAARWGGGTFLLSAISGTQTISTTTGLNINDSLYFGSSASASTATYQINNDINLGSGSYVAYLYSGTLNLNGFTLTCQQFSSTGALTRNLTFNGGSIVATQTSGQGFTASGSGFTTTAGTGTGKISFTGASGSVGFSGNGVVYNCTLELAGAVTLSISGNNTFTTISNTTTGARTFYFASGSTTTVTNFNVVGTSSNQVTITASSTTAATLSKSSGTVTVQYCTISKSTATGGATWKAPTNLGNVDGGTNTGWDFSQITSSGNGLFFGSNF